jgi:hypothetical protein
VIEIEIEIELKLALLVSPGTRRPFARKVKLPGGGK